MVKKIVLLLLVFQAVHSSYGQPAGKINRQAVVKRHTIIITKADSLSSLSVGNGQFAFTVDVTGLQSFPDYYKNGVPLGTQSAWGWHSFPNTENYTMAETMKVYEFEGRKISYPIQLRTPERNRQAVDYFRSNPHRLQLCNIGLEIEKKDGTLATIGDIKNIKQELNVWTGEIKSRFEVDGVPVEVVTVAHQQQDVIGLKINSALVALDRIQIRFRFPYPTGQWKDVGTTFKSENITIEEQPSQNTTLLTRSIDSTTYHIRVNHETRAALSQKEPGYLLLKPAVRSPVLKTTISFEQTRNNARPLSFDIVQQNSISQWARFWSSGGAIDFSGSKDKRAVELERRIILSQYLTKIQCNSFNPPQETGLTFNSWFGRPHLEMHAWHAIHFALWGRPELMEKSLGWYFTAFDTARSIAKRQGFEGVRWPKMTDNAGSESPSSIGAFLIWQQPHIIYMTELLYRLKKDEGIINKYRELVFATADFMASFPSYDSATKKYNLGKGLIPAQERFDPEKTFNPTYELAYWHWALNIAQQWRIRLGLPRNKKWDDVISHLAPLPEKDGVYLATQSARDSYSNEQYLTDHPAVLGAYAFLPPSNGLKPDVMSTTFDLIWKSWHWNDTWGWDFPLTSMAATRLKKPGKAIEALLMPVQKNTYLPNGHNYQDDRLTIYLPGNGGLLAAIAMMCAGYEGSAISKPGFPTDGQWNLKWEGLQRLF